MTTSVEYPTGAPAWLEASVPDPGRSAAFYGTLFGWDFFGWHCTEPLYALASLQGRRVAALTDMAPGDQPHWTPHLRVHDLEAAMRTAEELGGSVTGDPVRITALGTRVHVRDPSGAEFALWEPGGIGGSEAFGVPGSPVWAEASSPDVPATADFLIGLFGYEAERIADPDHTTLYSAGAPVCSVSRGESPQAPGSWLPYFMVRNVEVTAERTEELGGSVLTPAEGSAYGRWVLLADADGARFAILESPW